MYGMLPFFNYIIFIKSEPNSKNVKDVLKYFRTEDSELQQLMLNFTKICKKYPQKSTNQFFFYSTQLQKIFFCQNLDDSLFLHLDSLTPVNINTVNGYYTKDTANSSNNSTNQNTRISMMRAQNKNKKQKTSLTLGGGPSIEETRNQDILERFEHLTSFYEKKDQAKIVFGFILPCLKNSKIRLNDLTVEFSTSSKNPKRISLVDYIAALLSDNQAVKLDHQVLHHYLQTKCVIPNIFVINPNFKKKDGKTT